MWYDIKQKKIKIIVIMITRIKFVSEIKAKGRRPRSSLIRLIGYTRSLDNNLNISLSKVFHFQIIQSIDCMLHIKQKFINLLISQLSLILKIDSNTLYLKNVTKLPVTTMAKMLSIVKFCVNHKYI